VSSVLQAIVQGAVAATAASEGWLLGTQGELLRVVAAAGGGAPALIGTTIPSREGTAGYVIASGQPMALSLSPDDRRAAEGVIALLDHRPSTLLCVPCPGADGIAGALELVDKVGGTFTFDDVEIVTLMAGVAGVALEELGDGEIPVRSPGELAAELERLSISDPSGYRRTATIVEALLARG
jgi:hypothetical protein